MAATAQTNRADSSAHRYHFAPKGKFFYLNPGKFRAEVTGGFGDCEIFIYGTQRWGCFMRFFKWWRFHFLPPSIRLRSRHVCRNCLRKYSAFIPSCGRFPLFSIIQNSARVLLHPCPEAGHGNTQFGFKDVPQLFQQSFGSQPRRRRQPVWTGAVVTLTLGLLSLIQLRAVPLMEESFDYPAGSASQLTHRGRVEMALRSR